MRSCLRIRIYLNRLSQFDPRADALEVFRELALQDDSWRKLRLVYSTLGHRTHPGDGLLAEIGLPSELVLPGCLSA
jgi:hypothetical protein